ncbi:MAG: hypothetical protein ACYSTZ_13145 [Planctomycetota bacterium]|jgi:hypothetical protein
MGKKSRAKKERRVQARSRDSGIKELPQLHVGIPAYREVNANTVTSLINLQATYKGKIGVQILSGCYIEHARNEIANKAVSMGAKRLLFVDADIAFSIDDFVRLSRDLDRDPGMGAVCGIYVGWGGGNGLICGWWPNGMDNTAYEHDNQLKGWGHVENGDIVEVDKAGTGFMLIDTEVFKKIPPLWFATMAEAGDFWGEDTYFLQLLKHHGYRPSCDFGVMVEHIGPTPHRPDILSDQTKKQIALYKEQKENFERIQSDNETSNEVSN